MNKFINKIGIVFAVFVAVVLVFNEMREGVVFTVEEVVAVIDGDTFLIKHNGTEQSVRFRGIDTPEYTKPQCTQEQFKATQAKAFVTEQVEAAQRVTLLDLDKTADPYGRWLAWVYVDGVNLADLTIKAGLGRPYDGGQRASWCHQPNQQ